MGKEKMSIKNTLDRYLKKLEDKIDLDYQNYVRRVCERVFAFEEVDELPFISHIPQKNIVNFGSISYQ